MIFLLNITIPIITAIYKFLSSKSEVNELLKFAGSNQRE